MKRLNSFAVPTAFLFATTLLFTACNDDDTDPTVETTPPTIALTGGTSTEMSVSTGSTLTLNATIADNTDLSQVRVEIHDAFDGHSHGKTAAATPFVWDTVITVSGSNTYNLALAIAIPADAATGPYDVILEALDAAGNAAEFVEIDLTVTGTSAPGISDLTVDGAAYTEGEEIELEFESVDQLTHVIGASLTDADGLDEVELVLSEHGHGHEHGKTLDDGEEEPIWDEDIDLGGANSYTLNYTATFVKAALEEHGDYELWIKVVDMEGNISTAEILFHAHFD